MHKLQYNESNRKHVFENFSGGDIPDLLLVLGHRMVHIMHTGTSYQPLSPLYVVCMCVYGCVFVCVYVCVCVVYIYIYIYTIYILYLIYIYIYTYIHIIIYIYICIYNCVCMYVCMCVHAYACVSIGVCMCVVRASSCMRSTLLHRLLFTYMMPQ